MSGRKKQPRPPAVPTVGTARDGRALLVGAPTSTLKGLLKQLKKEAADARFRADAAALARANAEAANVIWALARRKDE